MRGALRHGAVTAVSLIPGGEHTRASRHFGGSVRGRRSRVVPTPAVLASRFAVMRRPTGAHIDQPQGDGGNSATLPKESTKDTVKTIRAGKAGRPATPVIHPVCISVAHGSRVPPAPGLPCALWPPSGAERQQTSGKARREIAKARLQVELRIGERRQCTLLRHCERHIRALVPRTQRSGPADAEHRPGWCAAEPGPTHQRVRPAPSRLYAAAQERRSASGTRA